MKKIAAITLLALALSPFASAQKQSVTIGGPGTNDKAVLLLVSGSKDQGIIIPIVSSTGAVSAGVAEKGMVVFDESDLPNGKVKYFDGSSWVTVGGGGSALLSIVGNQLQIGSGSATVNIANTAPTATGQLFMWDNAASRWTSTSAGVTPAPGNVLKWNGTSWEAGTDNVGAGSLPSMSAGQLITNNGTTNVAVTMSNDATFSQTGALTIGSNAVTSAKILDNTITTSDIFDGTISSNDLSGSISISTTGTVTAAGLSTAGTISAIGGAGNLSVGGNATIVGTTTINGRTYTWPSAAAGVGTVLQNNGSGTLSWAAAAAAFTNPMTTQGDIIFGAVGGTPTRLGGTPGVLKSTGAFAPTWGSVNLASADVSGTLNVSNGGTGATSALQNTIFAGPPAAAGAPTFRTLVGADIPNLDANKITTGTLPIARGGTGLSLTTPANGSLLIGNGTGFANAVLTPGTGINITNGAGTISISSTGMTNPITTTGDIIYGVGTTPTRLAGGAGFLRSTGAAAPAWAAVNLASADVTGLLPIVNGGTGATAIASNVVPRSTGTALTTSNITSDGTNTAIGTAIAATNRLTVSQSVAGVNSTAVRGNATGGTTNYGLYGEATGVGSTSYGVYGSASTAPTAYGVNGVSSGAGITTAYGVRGLASSASATTNYGIYGEATAGTTNWAGYFVGNTAITGALGVGAVPDFGTAGFVLTSQGSAAPQWLPPAGGGFSTNNIVPRGNGAGLVASSIFDDGAYTAINRSTPISGASRFDVGTNAAAGSFGGMYMDTQTGGRPFYGFSQGGGGGAWIEWDGADANKMKFVNGATAMTIQSNGFTGIGTTTPSTQLEVSAVSPQLTLRTTGAGVNETALLRFVNGVGGVIGTLGDPGSATQMELTSGTSIAFNTNFVNRANILPTGNFLINAPAAGTALDVTGFGNWDLANTEGDFKLGSSTHRLKMGIALAGGGAGDAYIGTEGGTNRLFIGTAESFANTQTLTVAGGRLGVGTIGPVAGVDVTLPATSTTSAGFQVNNDYTGTAAKTGLHSTLTTTGSGVKYGILNEVFGLAADASANYGIFNNMVPNGTGTVYGTYNTMSNVGTGQRIGTYNNISSAAGNTSILYGNYTFVNHAGTGIVYGAYVDANKASGQAGTLYGLNVTSDNDGTGDSYLLFGNAIGSTTGKEWGLYVTGEDESYFSSTVTFTTPSVGSLYALRITREGLPNDFWYEGSRSSDGDRFHGYNGVFKGNWNTTDGTYSPSSDRRLKKNIVDLPSVLSDLKKLRPVRYHMNEQKESDLKRTGFIAQEVIDYFPEFVSYDKGMDVYSLNYSSMSVIAIKAIQEQQVVIDKQREEIDQLKSDIEAIKQSLRAQNK